MNLRTYIVPASVNDWLACVVRLVFMALTSVAAAMESYEGACRSCPWRKVHGGLCSPRGGK